MRRLIVTCLSVAALAVQPAMAAQQDKAEKPEKAADKPITQQDPNAVDVATTPMTDLNIRKDQIPQILIDAQTQPYHLANMKRCAQIAAQVGELDAILGYDIDLPQTEGRKVSPGRVAQSVVGSFIPFRGVVREISGANAEQRRLQAAIQAGMVRRAFLKGIGEERGCRYPARSATREVWEQHARMMQEANQKDEASKEKVANAAQK